MKLVNKRSTKEYWNKRVLESETPRELVLNDVFLEEFEANTRQILSLFKDRKVLDVGCGYGRLSDIFDNYVGVDFSEEMIKLAENKYPSKTFYVGEHVDGDFDVVFECMCLSSFGLTPEQFAEKYDAPIVMCLEPKKFSIFYK